MLLAHLIQAGYYGHPSGFFYGMSAGTMGSWILIIVIGIVVCSRSSPNTPGCPSRAG